MVNVDVPPPSIQADVIQKNGKMSQAWYTFFQTLRKRTGGSTDIINQGTPAGILADFSSSSVPDGWLACDGSAVLRSQYANLFAVITTTYGAGDGSTTFNLPDARGRSFLGCGQGAGLTNRLVTNTGGVEDHPLASAENASHNHTITDPDHSHAVTDPDHNHGTTESAHSHNSASGSFVNNTGGSEYVNTAGDKGGVSASTASASTGLTIDSASTGLSVDSASTGISLASSGSGDAHQTMHPFLVVCKIIKT